MQRAQQQQLDRFLRGQEFLDRNQHLFPEANTTRARQQLGGAICNVQNSDGAVRGCDDIVRRLRVQILALRALLVDVHLRLIVAIGRMEFGGKGAGRAFRLPPANCSTRDLVLRAITIADIAAVHVGVFRAHGLPPNFIAQLLDAAHKIETTSAARDEWVAQRKENRADIRAALRDGRRGLRVLDAHVEPRIRKFPRLRASWLRVIAVKRRRARG